MDSKTVYKVFVTRKPDVALITDKEGFESIIKAVRYMDKEKVSKIQINQDISVEVQL